MREVLGLIIALIYSFYCVYPLAINCYMRGLYLCFNNNSGGLGKWNNFTKGVAIHNVSTQAQSDYMYGQER